MLGVCVCVGGEFGGFDVGVYVWIWCRDLGVVVLMWGVVCEVVCVCVCNTVIE